jgi:hypothetical protein
MSTPIREVEVSPEDPKFYAPPRWRRGEVVAPSIQPSLRSTEFPVSQANPDWTPYGDEALPDERERSMYEPVANASPRVRKPSARRGNRNMRVTALAIAAGVVLWTAVCIVLALGRLDAINFEQLRNGLPSAKRAEMSALAPPQTVNVAAVETPKEVVTPPANEAVTLPPDKEFAAPTLAVADAIGESNAALPLAIRVTNAAPGTTITLSGLAVGTKLSSGTVAGEGRWRIALDDRSGTADGLQSTFVTPPSDFVGPMTIIAELRSGTDQAIARAAPVRLTWRPSAIDLSETVKPTPPALSVQADYSAAPALLAWQDEPTTNGVSSPLKVRKYMPSASKSHSARNQYVARKRQNRTTSLAQQDPQASVTPWREVRSPFAYDISADRRAGRRSQWSDDVQNIIDRSWQRCTFNCDRDILR